MRLDEPRVKPLSDEEIDPEIRERIFQGPILNIFRTLAHHPALLKRYERLSERHRDVAVTRVMSEHCGACGQQLPPQLAVEVRKMETLMTCPACGRILIHYAD